MIYSFIARRKFGAIIRFVLTGFIAFGLWSLGKASGAESPGPVVEQAADDSVTLGAKDARVAGPNAKMEEGKENTIAWWTNMDTSLHWTAKIGKPGKYRVEMNFAVLGSGNRNELSIDVAGQIARAVLTSGTGMDDFKWGQAGDITISKSGVYPLTAAPVTKGHEFVIYLRSIVLRPADSPSQAADITGRPIQAGEDGSFKLIATDAEIQGMNAVLDGGTERNIGFWDDRDTTLRWVIAVQKPNTYRVEMNYSLTPSSGGSKLAVEIGGQTVTIRPKAGMNWADYKEGQAGEITITGTGDISVVLKPLSKPQECVLNLRSLTLAPVDLPTTAMDISDKPIRQGSGGTLKLIAEDAEIDGQTARLQGGDKKYVVWWGSRENDIRWPAIVDKPGKYDVMVTYSLGETENSSQVTLSADGQSVSGTLPPVHSWDKFETANLGSIDIPDKGAIEVAMDSPMDPGLHILNLRSVELVPARDK